MTKQKIIEGAISERNAKIITDRRMGMSWTLVARYNNVTRRYAVSIFHKFKARVRQP